MFTAGSAGTIYLLVTLDRRPGAAAGRNRKPAETRESKTMKTSRKILLATAFVLTLAGTFTGAALQGETKEVDVVADCATAAWPMIPAACLTDGSGQDVRYVSADNLDAANSADHRFTVAFN